MQGKTKHPGAQAPFRVKMDVESKETFEQKRIQAEKRLRDEDLEKRINKIKAELGPSPRPSPRQPRPAGCPD